jgi:hypothetical protein
MKRPSKIVVLVGLLLALLYVICWFSVPGAQRSLAPRLSFAGITNGLAGEPRAVFSVSNAGHRPVLFALILEVQTKNGSFKRWAAGPPARPATALAAAAATTFATQLPDLGSVLRLKLIWQRKPTIGEYAYADGLDGLLRFFGRVGYPSGLNPSARTWNNTWNDILFTPEMLHEHGAEQVASPNGGPTVPVGISGVAEGRHR